MIWPKTVLVWSRLKTSTSSESLSGPNTLPFLQLLITLLTRSVVNVCAISKDLLFVSLVTNRVSLEEVCLPSFDVLNCWLNLSASCLDDENELPLKVIASCDAALGRTVRKIFHLCGSVLEGNACSGWITLLVCICPR